MLFARVFFWVLAKDSDFFAANGRQPVESDLFAYTIIAESKYESLTSVLHQFDSGSSSSAAASSSLSISSAKYRIFPSHQDLCNNLCNPYSQHAGWPNLSCTNRARMTSEKPGFFIPRTKVIAGQLVDNGLRFSFTCRVVRLLLSGCNSADSRFLAPKPCEFAAFAWCYTAKLCMWFGVLQHLCPFTKQLSFED